MSDSGGPQGAPESPSFQGATASDVRQVLIGKSSSREARRRFQERFNEVSFSAEREFVHLGGLKDHYKHKAGWSVFIGFLMFVMISFQCVLLGFVGAGIWDFSKYSWLLPALLVQNLGQIVGLAVFVVKALFKDLHRD